MPCGEKNPELTVCQVRTATAALVRACQLGRRAARTILEAAAADIAYTQRRNAAARRSHTRTKLQVLAETNIQLHRLPRCQWDES